MAGVHFKYENFLQLLKLNIGISDRLDQNRAESFTLLYCDLSGIDDEIIESSLREILRTSDSIINYEKDYYFVLPYTDKYGANIVKKMFDEFYAKFLNSFLISYPADGENAEELIEVLQNSVSTFCKKDINYLDFLKE
jgi:hypothetical protein